MPSLATSPVEPTASAPSAPAGELATAAIATIAMTHPNLIILCPCVSGILRLASLPASDNRSRVIADFSCAAPKEHQREPLVERDARLEFQSLHSVGADRRRSLRGEQAGQDDVSTRREHA